MEDILKNTLYRKIAQAFPLAFVVWCPDNFKAID